MTVDSWFEFWITNLIADLASNTKRNYRERYKKNIQPVIGTMRMCDVKPMHLSPKPSNSSSKTPVWQVKKWCAAEKIGVELVRNVPPNPKKH